MTEKITKIEDTIQFRTKGYYKKGNNPELDYRCKS